MNVILKPKNLSTVANDPVLGTRFATLLICNQRVVVVASSLLVKIVATL